MRVSTNWLFEQGMRPMMEQEAALSKTRERITSGRDLLQAEDDPVRAVRARELEKTLAAGEQFARNTDHAEQRLALEESIIGEVENVLQRVRELAVQAANDSLNPADREIVATELEERYNELLDLANSRDSNGEYLFAGTRTETMPFQLSAGTVTYQGDNEQRRLQLSETRQVAVSDSGQELFMAIPKGNGTFEVSHDAASNTGSGVIDPGTVIDPDAYAASVQAFDIVMVDDPTDPDSEVDGYEIYDRANPAPALPLDTGAYEPGTQIEFNGIEISIDGEPAAGDTFQVDPSGKQDVFATVQGLIDSLRTPTGTPADRGDQRNGIKRALTNLEQGLHHLVEQRGDMGGRLRTTLDQKTIHESVNLRFKETLSDVAATDITAAVIDLSEQQTALSAAQRTFTQMQRLSLFDLL